MKNINAQTRHFIKCNFNQVQNKLLTKYSPAESKFVELLRNAGIYFKRERGRFRRGQEWCYYDFFLPYYRIYIEIDGIEHSNEKVKQRDKLKEKYISNNQSYVARFSNEEVLGMDNLTLDMIVERVAIWLSLKRKPKNRSHFEKFIKMYWKGLETHLKQSENDIRKGDTPIDDKQKIYLYDHHIGDYFEFENIIEAKQTIKDFNMPILYDLVYTFDYKPSPQRRYVFGRTLEECEQRVAQVYY